jgi:hypothetical protein
MSTSAADTHSVMADLLTLLRGHNLTVVLRNRLQIQGHDGRNKKHLESLHWLK